MSNAPCNHVVAVCVIGNFWNCTECDAEAAKPKYLPPIPGTPDFKEIALGEPQPCAITEPYPNYRKLAKVTPFPKSYEITCEVRKDEPSVVDVEIQMLVHDEIMIRVRDGGDPVDLTGAEVTFTPVDIADKFDEDFFVPVRGDMDIKVDDKGNVLTTSDLEDIAYFQKKLFESLRVPKEYLSVPAKVEAEGLTWEEYARRYK